MKKIVHQNHTIKFKEYNQYITSMKMAYETLILYWTIGAFSSLSSQSGSKTDCQGGSEVEICNRK